jgi:outer membrane receptor protein involved in Fe transport
MIRKVLCSLFVMLFSVALYAQQGAIKGKVLDTESGEAIPFANVVVELNGTQIGGGVSDFDGNYTIKPIQAGSYTVKASYVGYTSIQVNDVIVHNDQVCFLNLKLKATSQNIEEVTVTGYAVPLIEKDNTQQGGTVTSEEISKMAGRSPESVAATVGGVYSENGQIKSIRGSRDGGTVFYIDGVKVRGTNNIPKASIAEISVVTGGVPARYGDAMGGVINITTKGASRTFFGGLEFTTSKFLDAYNENLLGFNLSGPILSRKIVDPNNPNNIYKEPLVGFFFAAELSSNEDNNPSATGVWKAKDNILDSISRTPMVLTGSNAAAKYSALYLKNIDFENVDANQNLGRKRGLFQGKIDIQPTQNFIITIGGDLNIQNGNESNFTSYNSFNNIAAGTGIDYSDGISYANQIFNSDNNPYFKYRNWRAFARITQKFGNQESSEESASIIKNAYYTLQGDFSNERVERGSEQHGKNFFEYGYIGKFTTYRQKSYNSTYDQDTTLGVYGYHMNNWEDTAVIFEPGSANPLLANYTSIYYQGFSPDNLVDITEGNGLLNGDMPDPLYGIVQLPGTVSNNFQKDDNDQIRISAYGAADIKDHEISLGFEFEKRTDRQYILRPNDLWYLARTSVNSHITELDLANPIMIYLTDANGNYVLDGDGNRIYNDTIDYNRLYNGANQTLFSMRFRRSQNLSDTGTEWIDIDSYDPSELSLNYFSADELYNGGSSSLITSSYGFDVYGNKLTSKPTFEDFFSKTYTETTADEMVHTFYKREIAPFEPIYTSFFLQDKFAFNDLIFNIGARIDRYDANQKVQKDPYSIYEIFQVGDIDGVGSQTNDNGKGILASATIPANIPKGAYVYVDNKTDAHEIVGFRVDNKWYNADGTEINDPSLLYRNGSIQPYLKQTMNYAGSSSFFNAFKDYNPIWTVMPRIAFSFPISDEALFFAHYDILTQRPGTGTSHINPFDYLFMEQLGSNYFANSNLKPQKTIDYELGFQQKLTDASVVKLSAFYREQRDMINLVQLVGAYPSTITTYSNQDFGTIKGFNLTYDLRRTGNVMMKVSYSLQFANATGSDPNTAANLITAGQPGLRTTVPTDFDQRHNFSVLFDYRFGEGKDYNGPKWFGADILANAGANFVLQSGSGSPFTKRDINSTYVVGTINGSRMPWHTTIDMKIDKSFTLTFGEGDNKKITDLNIYLDVQNLLNTKNTLHVYTYTGNANDDGYLSAAKNQSAIENAEDTEAYINYYSMLINNPARYSLPRRFRLGFIFSF